MYVFMYGIFRERNNFDCYILTCDALKIKHIGNAKTEQKYSMYVDPIGNLASVMTSTNSNMNHIIGVVYDIPDNLIPIIDRVECQYNRIETNVILSNGNIKRAWMYVDSTQVLHSSPSIPIDGDYYEYENNKDRYLLKTKTK